MQKEVDYAESKKAQYPKGVFIAIARHPDGKYNPVTVGSVVDVSADPPMMAVSLFPTHYSTAAIRHSGEFVVALPSEHQAEETMFYGTHHGHDTDKLALTKSKTERAHKIDCVLLSDAVANYECKLVSEMETGDHITFVGEVICSHVNEKPLRRLHIVGPGYKMGAVE